MPATPDQLASLREVNRAANALEYVTDSPLFGEAPDTWKFRPDGKGWECRDYAEAKAVALQGLDWPQSALSIVLCYTEPLPGYPDGEYHAVLWVEAGDETWCLDNRAPDIYRWDRPPYPYRWALRQVAGTDGFLDISST